MAISRKKLRDRADAYMYQWILRIYLYIKVGYYNISSKFHFHVAELKVEADVAIYFLNCVFVLAHAFINGF